MKNILSLTKEYFLVIVLILVNLLVWSLYYSDRQNKFLEVDFLDIGQGDAIFIEAPNGRQILIDGGRDASVLGRLAEMMGFFDRSIDIVLATHPDADHVGGLPAVLEHYRVLNFIDSVADADTAVYGRVEDITHEKNIKTYFGMRGMTIILDKKNGVYLEVLYPGPDDNKLKDTNDLSIVAKLIYGNTAVMLTGDATKLVEGMLVSTDGNYLESDILKAGHHGSKTSSSKAFVDSVGASYSIISAGKDNSYGHPHAITMKTLTDSGAKILETSKEGTIQFYSDGKKMTLRK